MNKKILRLAIPNILSNLSVPLLSSVDTAVVGHLNDVAYLGAIAIGSMIFNFLYWGFGFLRMGTTGLIAQAYGKKDEQEISLIFSRSIATAVISGLLLIALQELISFIGFYLINASPEVEHLASDYFSIRIYAAPAALTLYAVQGWFLGMQNAKYPLILAVSVNLVNIFFNLLFIYEFHMKSNGVALGTVIAQYFGLGLAGFLYVKKYSSYKINFDLKKIFDVEPLKRFVKVNFDILVRTLSLVFVFSYFTAVSAEMGDDILAVNTILFQLWMILSYGVDGFAFASESLAGKYKGSKDYTMFKRTIRYSFYWGIGLGIIFSFAYLIFGKAILTIYTDQKNLIELGIYYFTWTIAAPVINSICYIWDGIYIGATATKAMRNSMLICTLVIFLPLQLWATSHWGNQGLWFSLLVFMFSRGVILTIFSGKNIFNMNLFK